MIKGRHSLAYVLDKMDTKYVELYSLLFSKYNGVVNCGNRRVCFYTDRGFVVKMPWRIKGELDNLIEAREYNKDKNFAKCKLVIIKEIPVLVMEEVYPVDSSNLPEWCKEIDSSQVGINRAGKLVAYDYAMVRGQNV